MNYAMRRAKNQTQTHGGQRKGAGRTKGSFVNVPKKEPTKVIRVPVSKLVAIKEFIKNT